MKSGGKNERFDEFAGSEGEGRDKHLCPVAW
jgi:hypothetical protein